MAKQVCMASVARKKQRDKRKKQSEEKMVDRVELAG